MKSVFVQNVMQKPVQPGLAIRTMSFVANARTSRGGRYDSNSAYYDRNKNSAQSGAEYEAVDHVNDYTAGKINDVGPRRSGGDPLKLAPQQTPAEKAMDKEDTLGGSRGVGAYHGDRVAAGGQWTEEGGSNGVDRSQGAGGGDAVRSGFAPSLSVTDWDKLMSNKVLARRQGRSSGAISTISSPSNDPNIYR